jgi:hypothetical protein
MINYHQSNGYPMLPIKNGGGSGIDATKEQMMNRAN